MPDISQAWLLAFASVCLLFAGGATLSTAIILSRRLRAPTTIVIEMRSCGDAPECLGEPGKS